MNADERTEAQRKMMADIPRFALVLMAGSVTAPTPFDGEWLHTTTKGTEQKIRANGWAPGLVKNTIYGAAVYLARAAWHQGQDMVTIRVRLELTASEVRCQFVSTSGTGDSHDHLVWYLKDQGIVSGKSAGPGTSPHNQKIAAHFTSKGIKAVAFNEHGVLVVAVYDPTCIRVV